MIHFSIISHNRYKTLIGHAGMNIIDQRIAPIYAPMPGSTSFDFVTVVQYEPVHTFVEFAKEMASFLKK
jgi:hypothetical protein